MLISGFSNIGVFAAVPDTICVT